MSENQNGKTDQCLAVVDEVLPNSMFRVTLNEGGEQIISYLSGKMKIHKIKIIVGDTVSLKLDEYGGNRNRIIKRL